MTFIDWILGLGTLCVVATLIVLLVATLWFFYTLFDDVKKCHVCSEFKKDKEQQE